MRSAIIIVSVDKLVTDEVKSDKLKLVDLV